MLYGIARSDVPEACLLRCKLMHLICISDELRLQSRQHADERWSACLRSRSAHQHGSMLESRHLLLHADMHLFSYLYILPYI